MSQLIAQGSITRSKPCKQAILLTVFHSFPISSATLLKAGTLNDLLLEKPGVIHSYKIDNIYYDFDRYFIRPDAEPALNKLVRIMKEVPANVGIGSTCRLQGF